MRWCWRGRVANASATQRQRPHHGGQSDRAVCGRTFVMPMPYPVARRRLERAVAGRDLAAVRAAAREVPGGLGLAVALAVLALMEELDDPHFERAAVRWISRFAGECGAVGLGELQAALEAIDAPPAPAATATTAALLTRHGHTGGPPLSAPTAVSSRRYRSAHQ